MIKSYTDLEQSKKLAKILSLESADMYYPWYIEEDGDNIKSGHRISIPSVGNLITHKVSRMILSCWSLAALLDILPILDNRSPVLSKTFDRKYRVVYHSTAYEKAIYTEDFDNPVDACVAMIERLHELKML